MGQSLTQSLGPRSPVSLASLVPSMMMMMSHFAEVSALYCGRLRGVRV